MKTSNLLVIFKKGVDDETLCGYQYSNDDDKKLFNTLKKVKNSFTDKLEDISNINDIETLIKESDHLDINDYISDAEEVDRLYNITDRIIELDVLHNSVDLLRVLWEAYEDELDDINNLITINVDFDPQEIISLEQFNSIFDNGEFDLIQFNDRLFSE